MEDKYEGIEELVPDMSGNASDVDAEPDGLDVGVDVEAATEEAEAEAVEETEAATEETEAATEETEAATEETEAEANVPWWDREKPPESPLTDKEWGAAKKLMRRMRDYQQEGDRLHSQLQLKERELAQQRQALESLKDPDKLLDYVAKLKGKSRIETYQEITDKVIEEQDGPGLTKADVERLVQQRLEEERAAANGQGRNQAHEAIQAQRRIFLRTAQDISLDPSLVDEYPNLAVLPDGERVSRVDHALTWAQKEAPELTFRQLLKKLDKVQGDEFNRIADRLGYSRARSDSEKVAPPNQAKKSLSNSDVVGGAARTDYANLSREERLRAAAEVLPDLSGLF